MFFLEKVRRRGGGFISRPNNFITDFLYYKRYILVLNFGEIAQKGGGGHIQS